MHNYTKNYTLVWYFHNFIYSSDIFHRMWIDKRWCFKRVKTRNRLFKFEMIARQKRIDCTDGYGTTIWVVVMNWINKNYPQLRQRKLFIWSSTSIQFSNADVLMCRVPNADSSSITATLKYIVSINLIEFIKNSFVTCTLFAEYIQTMSVYLLCLFIDVFITQHFF